MASIGRYAFLLGVLLALIIGIIAGVMPPVLSGLESIVLLALIILGLIVGIANIKEAQNNEFLVAVIAVAMVGIIPVQQSAQIVPVIAPVISSVFQNIVAFAAPSALVVGLRQIWALGYSRSK